MSKNPLDALTGNLGNSLGDYLREQRVTNKLSVRQLSAIAGISNPYLSQIERGVKRPSAEILQQIARGLSISAETLYVQAGLLDPKDAAAEAGATTRAAIAADPALSARQRQTLIEIYESFVGTAAPRKAAKKTPRTATAQVASKKAAKKSAASTKGSAASSAPKRASASRAARGTTTSSSTSTTRRNS